jgi:hypothetical protein
VTARRPREICSRFLNVISLFNGAVPLIAIQMRALRIGDVLTLDFTTVVDELTRGLVDEDEDAQSAPADRAYWEAKANKETVALADELLTFAQASDPTLGLNYTKFYIGLQRNGQVCNFATFRPRKTRLVLGVRLPETEELTREDRRLRDRDPTLRAPRWSLPPGAREEGHHQPQGAARRAFSAGLQAAQRLMRDLKSPSREPSLFADCQIPSLIRRASFPVIFHGNQRLSI